MAAIMPTLLSGVANGARQGILFKSGIQLEIMGKVRAIAFDKTGTLTTGKPQVVEIIPASGQSESSVLQIAGAIEAFSEHPIGNAIAQTAQDHHLSVPTATNVRSQTGFGIIGEVDTKQVKLGKAAFVKSENSDFSEDLIKGCDRLESEGKTVVWVAADNQILGIIAIADTLRPAAAATVKRLKQLGIEQIIMLTGDNERTAKSVAQQLGIDQVYAELLPEDKVSVIHRLQQQYQTVAMVGDGINDAPALATASVGIAMGAAGSDVALETADIVLMADRLEKLSQAINLGRRADKIVKQNIIFALSAIVLLLIANFTANITLPLGVIGHEGSTVLVTLSGLRLLKN